MTDAHKNLAVSFVDIAPSPAISGSSLTVTAGHGTRFPATPFNATVWPASVNPDPLNAEIVRVTNIATDTLTITRAQEGTSAISITSGFYIANTITVKVIEDIENSSVILAPATDARNVIQPTAATVVPLTVRGAAAQSDSLVVVEDSAGTDLVVVGPTGAVTLTGTDPAQAVLTLRADDVQTEHVFRVYDDAGDLAVDIDAIGIMDARHLVIQDPPDVGTDNVVTDITPGKVKLNPAVGDDALQIYNASLQNVLIVRRDGFGSILEISPRTATDSAYLAIAHASQSANLLEFWNNAFDTIMFAVSAAGRITATPPAAATYTASNVSTDRSYDANATTIDELADVLGTLIADLRTQGLVA